MCDAGTHAIGTKYLAIKRRLESLGYVQSLPLDSLGLVEQLLADLIKTTESLKRLKNASDNIENRNPQVRTKDEIEEWSRLHSELLECKENHLKATRELKRKIQKLESEAADFQLATARNLKRIKDLEAESAGKSKRIQELLGKSLRPTVSNSLGPKKRAVFPLRRPVLEADPLPIEAGDSNRSCLPSRVDPKTIDLMAMADRKIGNLKQELAKLKNDLAQQRDNVALYREQLALRDKEVCRLKKLLEPKDCSCSRNFEGTNKLSDLNEVRVLQQAKLNLELQLRDALDKQHDAMTQAMKLAERNEELEKELKDVDHIALAVEADCNSTVKENNKRVGRLQEKLETTMAQIRQLETNLLSEKRTSQELRADLESCRVEKRNIQHSLENLEAENRQLTGRINDLNIIEPDLNAEISRLEKVNQSQRFELTELREEINLLKNQIENLNKLSSSKKVSRNSSGTDKRLSHDKSSKQVAEKEEKIKALEKTIQQLERDKSYYRDEWNKLLSQKKDADSSELWSQICELKQQLNEKELKITELQQERKELAREKFELENKLQSSRSMGSCNFSESSKNSQLRVLERERDSARSDVNRLTEERDILRERLKLATDAHTSEQRRLRERLRDLELKLEDVEREKHNYILSQDSKRSALTGLEDQLEDAREELRRTKQELGSQRTQYFQLRALQDQTDQALGDVQSQLHHSEAELTKTVDHSRVLEQQNVQLSSQVKEQKQEINTLRSNMARLDREKDQLLMELDEKTEKIAALEREVVLKEQQTSGIEQQLRETQRKNQICVDETAEQERQLRNLQLELENSSRQVAAAVAERDNAAMENRRLQDDLAAVTCEVRSLQRELEASRVESHDLKRQLQTYFTEVRRAGEILSRKENERTEMLVQFKNLSLEASVLENNNHSLESEAAEARGALQSARDRLVDLERQLADKNCLIRRYEAQITELTQTVASLEIQIRQQLELRETAETDLNAVRDLSVQLDQQKEALRKEIAEKDALIAKYEAKLSRFKAENNAVHDQQNRDHVTIDRLQMMLDQARRESVDCQKNNQELLNEIDRMKLRISDLQNKLSSESAELKRCQNQAAEYSSQIAELRRKVTDERFNRARTEEEHRRSFPYSDQLHMSGEPAQAITGVSPSTRDFATQELGTNVRSRDGEPSGDDIRNFSAETKEGDLTDIGYVVYQQEENPQVAPSRRKLLPCAKTCCTEDSVENCPASRCDKSVNTDEERKKRKKTQTGPELRPEVADAEISVPAVADASVSSSNSDEVPSVPEVPAVPDVSVPPEPAENRRVDRVDRQGQDSPGIPSGTRRKATVPAAPIPGPSGIGKKRGRPRKDDCGCNEEIQLPNCRAHVPVEPPEQDPEESFHPNESLNRAFERVHDLTRSIQERLNSVSVSGEDSQPGGARSSHGSSRRSRDPTVEPEDDEIVIEESSESLIIETGPRRPEREAPSPEVPERPLVGSREVPKVGSELVPPRRPQERASPRPPSPPRLRVPTPPRFQDPTPPKRVPTPSEAVSGVPKVPSRSQESPVPQVPKRPEVPSSDPHRPEVPRPVLSSVPHRPEVPVPVRQRHAVPIRVPQRTPVPNRPTVPVPASQKPKKPPKEKSCNLARCRNCPMPRPPRNRVQFPGTVQPIHTSSPRTSGHGISRPNHRYHLRSHARTVYTFQNAGRNQSSGSSSGSDVVPVRKKKSRRLSSVSSDFI